ncbi:MAG: YceI family protein, partial [Pseudohongiellaceae bacterium]
MMFKSFCRALLLVIVPLTVSGTVQADWELSNEESTLSFVTIKADNVAEVHTFDRIAGSLSEEGALQVVIELISVNTLIPIRNERMQNLLFETGMFPQATVTGNIDMTMLASLAPGSSTALTAQFNLNLHAQSNILPAELTVTRLADG